MIGHSMKLLSPRRRADLLGELITGVGTGGKAAGLLATMVCGAALYGAVLGAWRGGMQPLYAAVKLPLVLLVTSALTLVFNWLTGYLLGLRIGLLKVAAINFLVLATAAVVLVSLVPVAGLFVYSAPAPALTERTTHNLLYLFHTGVVGLSALTGTTVLWRGLVLATGQTLRAARIFAMWFLAFMIVGGEVAWALRPFVGSIYHPVVFLRPDLFDGNVYEFIARDIAPHLWPGR
jgi:hypothetical protein